MRWRVSVGREILLIVILIILLVTFLSLYIYMSCRKGHHLRACIREGLGMRLCHISVSPRTNFKQGASLMCVGGDGAI